MELIVTIAILAIVATLAAPSFGQVLINQKLKKTATETKIRLLEARSRAMLTRSPTVVCPSTVAVSTCGENITGYSKLHNAQKEGSVFLFDVDPKVTIKTNSANHILFSPMGQTTAQTITLCGDKRSFIVSISIPGVVTVEQKGVC